MDLVELSRLVENLIRIGTIHSVDHVKRRCRVQSGALVTQWLAWIEQRAGETTTWNPPTVGEQAVVFSPSGEPGNGIVFYGVPSDVIDTPSHDPVMHIVKFPDGAVLSYDHDASRLTVTGIKTFLVAASDSGVFDCPDVTFTGKVKIEDLLTYLNGLRGSGGASGNGNTITGEFTHTEGNLSSNNVVLHSHVHSGVYAGSDNSGWPVGWE